VNIRRLLVILLSPLWLALAAVSLVVGAAFVGGTNLAEIISAIYTGTTEAEQIAYLLARALLLPFQVGFIVIVFAAALRIFRRREQIGRWLIGDPPAEATTTGREMPFVREPGRRRTMQQIASSLIAISALLAAFVLSLAQFVARDDLAVVVAALTSSLAWGARLPIGDFLGGINNIFESSLVVGDHVLYRQLDQTVEGIVEAVDIRFVSIRALTGELTTIPFGELRIFTNYSRGHYRGVYAAFPVAAHQFGQAMAILNELAPQSPDLLIDLIEPWQPISLDGEMGALVDLCLFGKTIDGRELELQLAMRELVQERFAAAGIPIGGAEEPPL
jgi:small conductance mechanosensitive channel